MDLITLTPSIKNAWYAGASASFSTETVTTPGISEEFLFKCICLLPVLQAVNRTTSWTEPRMLNASERLQWCRVPHRWIKLLMHERRQASHFNTVICEDVNSIFVFFGTKLLGTPLAMNKSFLWDSTPRNSTFNSYDAGNACTVSRHDNLWPAKIFGAPQHRSGSSAPTSTVATWSESGWSTTCCKPTTSPFKPSPGTVMLSTSTIAWHFFLLIWGVICDKSIYSFNHSKDTLVLPPIFL